MLEEWRFIVQGSVQGVFFRANTHMLAKKLGLVGKVGNEPDGSVRCVAQGEPDRLEKLYVFLKTHPGSSKVETVSVDKRKINERGYEDFTIY